MVKALKKLQNTISTPLQWYGIAAGIGIILVCIYWLIPCRYGRLATTTISIGTGAIASAIVALLIDIGNSKREKKQDRLAFDRIKAEITLEYGLFIGDLSFNDFLSSNCFPKDDMPVSYWLERFFTTTADENLQKACELPAIRISTICEAADRLLARYELLNHNQFLTDEFYQVLRHLSESSNAFSSYLASIQKRNDRDKEFEKDFESAIEAFLKT